MLLLLWLKTKKNYQDYRDYIDRVERQTALRGAMRERDERTAMYNFRVEPKMRT